MNNEFEEFCIGQMKPVIPITGGKEGILTKNPVSQNIDDEYNALELSPVSISTENETTEGDPPEEEPESDTVQESSYITEACKNIITEKDIPKNISLLTNEELSNMRKIVKDIGNKCVSICVKHKNEEIGKSGKKLKNNMKVLSKEKVEFIKNKNSYIEQVQYIFLNYTDRGLNGSDANALETSIKSIMREIENAILKKVKKENKVSIVFNSDEKTASVCISQKLKTVKEVKESTEEIITFESVEDDNYEIYLESDTKVDDDIKPIIDKLNEKGYETKYSCSGHPSARIKKDVYRDGIYKNKLYSTARIVFAKKYDIGSAPKYWMKKELNDGELISLYVEPPTFKILNGLPKDAFTKWKNNYMNSLEKWVNELPKEGEKKEEEDVVESVLDDLLIDSM